MSVADGMRKMLALGIPVDEALAIVEAFEIPVTDARKERNRRYYEAHKPVLKRLNSDAETEKPKRLKASEKRLNSDGAPRAHVEDKTLFLEIEPQEQEERKLEPTLSREPTPREILLTVLDVETADAVMQHRKGKRSPLTTPLAARGLVKAFSEYPGGPVAAATMMVTNGWTGFKRDYWDKPQQRGSPGQPSALELRAQKLRERIENEHGFGRERGGNPDDVERLPLLIEGHRRER